MSPDQAPSGFMIYSDAYMNQPLSSEGALFVPIR